MPIAVKCGCGREFAVRDEFSGKGVKCPACPALVSVPALFGAEPSAADRHAADTATIKNLLIVAAAAAAGLVALAVVTALAMPFFGG